MNTKKERNAIPYSILRCNVNGMLSENVGYKRFDEFSAFATPIRINI